MDITLEELAIGFNDAEERFFKWMSENDEVLTVPKSMARDVISRKTNALGELLHEPPVILDNEQPKYQPTKGLRNKKRDSRKKPKKDTGKQNDQLQPTVQK